MANTASTENLPVGNCIRGRGWALEEEVTSVEETREKEKLNSQKEEKKMTRRKTETTKTQRRSSSHCRKLLSASNQVTCWWGYRPLCVFHSAKLNSSSLEWAISTCSYLWQLQMCKKQHKHGTMVVVHRAQKSPVNAVYHQRSEYLSVSVCVCVSWCV